METWAWGQGVGTGEQSRVEGEEQAGKSEGKPGTPVMFGFGVQSPGWRKVPEVSGEESGSVHRISSTWLAANLNFSQQGCCREGVLIPATARSGGRCVEGLAARVLGAARGTPTSLCTRPQLLAGCVLAEPPEATGPHAEFFV